MSNSLIKSNSMEVEYKPFIDLQNNSFTLHNLGCNNRPTESIFFRCFDLRCYPPTIFQGQSINVLNSQL